MPETALLPLAESVADGHDVDWQNAEAEATSDDQGVIRQLRVLSNLAALHRSLPATPHDEPNATPRRSAGPAIGSWAHLSLVERLGGGTFGEVFRAWDGHLEREVALKLLRLDEATDDPQASRIAREGRLLARVRHPNVITVHNVEIHEGRVGLCMELVRGTTLEEVLQKQGSFSAREAALIGIDLCRALAAIHAAGLIHRDVKAQNVMREDGGRIVLMDLGTGREVDPQQHPAFPDLAGTPLYLAPEVFEGARASERTDLYSLGVLMYHLVTGSFPVPAASVDELRDAQIRGTAVRLRDKRADLPTAFVRVVDRAIARDPAGRYASAGALEADLLEALNETTASGAAAALPRGVAPPWGLLADRWAAALAVGAAAVLMVAALVWWRAGDRSPAAVPSHVSLLAVLPFQDLSADVGEANLANAVPMELTAKLGQIGALRVVPWTFMRQFGLPGHSLTEVAKRTGADVVVEGTVQRAPERPGESRRVQVHVQLFQAGTGTLVWSAAFEREIGDFFALQAEMAREIAARVHVVLAARDQMLFSRSRSVRPDAMEDYLNARSMLVQMNLPGAIELFRRVTEESPDFAEAYVGLASCYALQSAYFGAVPSQLALRRALDASNRAIELDSRLPVAWAARAFARFTLERNWSGAESDFRRALEINAVDVDALQSYSNYLTIRGRHVEAIDAARTAENRAPLSAEASRQVAWAYYMAHQYDSAIQQVRRTFEIEPDYVPARTVLGRAYLLKGEWPRALEELERVGKDYPHHLALGYAVSGRRQDAERLLNEMLAPSSGRPVIPYQVGLIYAALGDTNKALDWLETAYTEKDPAVIQMGVDPSLDQIRGEPRFQRLRVSLNLQP